MLTKQVIIVYFCRMKTNDRLQELIDRNDENWQRLTFNIRKHLDIWTHKNVKPNWGQMKLSYMPILFNINLEGSTPMDISRKSMTAKQTVSRTLKELQEKGMISTKTNANDKRSELLELTPKGKQFALEARTAATKLEETYKELVGEKKLAIAVEVLNKIIRYHESLMTGEEEHFGD